MISSFSLSSIILLIQSSNTSCLIFGRPTNEELSWDRPIDDILKIKLDFEKDDE